MALIEPLPKGWTNVGSPSVDAPLYARENVWLGVARGRMLSSVRPLTAFRNGTELLLAAGRFLQRRQSEPSRENRARPETLRPLALAQ